MPAGKRIDTLKTMGIDSVLIKGSFRPNGATGIVASSELGKGYSVARTSAGLYTITFDDVYPYMLMASGSARVADATPTIVQMGDFSASNKTLQIRVLQAATAGVTEAKGFIPLDIVGAREIATNAIQNLAAVGGLLASDSTPILERVNAATDKALRLNWAATVVDELAFAPVVKPVDMVSGDVTVHLLVAKGSNTDTAAVIDVQAWDGVGDTEMGGNTAALATADLTEYTVTLADANIAAHPGALNIQLVPGAHNNDAIYVYGAWIEYTRADWATTGQVFSLADMAADVDNVVNFSAIFANTNVWP